MADMDEDFMYDQDDDYGLVCTYISSKQHTVVALTLNNAHQVQCELALV